jgi:circadian clock protein KaiB
MRAKSAVAKRRIPRRKIKESDTTAEFERLLRKSAAKSQRYVLRLYITGSSPRSTQAISNIRSLCDEHLRGRYDLEVVDIYQQPAEAADQKIIAAPTLIKRYPSPPRRMVGDLSNRDRVLVGLDLNGEGTAWLKV